MAKGSISCPFCCNGMACGHQQSFMYCARQLMRCAYFKAWPAATKHALRALTSMPYFKPRPSARLTSFQQLREVSTNFSGKNLNIRRMARRVKYMDVFHNKSRSPANLLFGFYQYLVDQTGAGNIHVKQALYDN